MTSAHVDNHNKFSTRSSKLPLDESEALRLARICSGTHVVSVELSQIAELWGGMGHVYRASPVGSGDFIIKFMNPRMSSRHPSVGDKRKLNSYLVEAHFYQSYSKELAAEGIGLANCLFVETEGTKTTICLSVLHDAPHVNFHQQTLEWLADFHAVTWNKACPGLQEVGTYWHLQTRKEEHHRMSSRGWEGRLKLAARAIDEWLKATDIQSWVHGDPKEENVLWNGHQIALCDFQYVGRGCPAKDVAYFLCSCGIAQDSQLVDTYYNRLCSKLNKVPSRKDFDVALELAFCDYLRFMCGWGIWGSDISQRVIKMLEKIDGGARLTSEEAYIEALNQIFPN
jgi:hypothetical protein